MAGQADGSIIIETELKSDGFKAGSTELLTAIKSLSEEVKNLKTTLTDLFKKPLTPNIDTSGAQEKIAALEAQVQELETSLGELRKSGNTGTPETAAPQVDIGSTTKSTPDLQREIDSVNNSVQKLEPTFKKAMSGSESAMNSFQGKATALESKITQLRQQLDAVGKAKIPTQKYQELCDSLDRAAAKADALRERQKTLDAHGVSRSSSQWKNLQIDLDLAAQKCDRLAASISKVEDSGSAFQMGSDTSQYAQMESTLSAAASKLKEMQDGTNQSESGMSRLASAARSVASFIGKSAKSAAGALVSGIKSAASGMAKMLFHGKKMGGQFGELISGAKKFALSLLGARGVYALLRKAVSAYMAENQQLSNTLSACWSGIGNLLGPIITKLINLVAQAVSYVTSFLRLFGVFGKSATKAIGSAGGAASKAAKELKRQLMSFDELNILSSKDETSGGGGGASNTAGTLPDTTLPDWAKLMAEQIKTGDWAAAASTLTAQLNNAVASVDWGGIGSKIGFYLNGALTFLATFIQSFDWKNLASHFAELLNNIITGVDWGNLGVILTGKWAIILKSLDGFFGTLSGASVSKAITDFMYGTVNAADWVSISGSLSKNISGFISDINFSALAKALSTQIRTALQSMIASIENFDWAMLGKKVADFLNGIDWSGIFSDLIKLLGGLLIGVLNSLVGFVEQVDWKGLADEIWACFESLVTDIDWDSFGASLGKLISGIITGILDLIGSLFGDHDWGTMVQDLVGGVNDAIGEVIKNIDWLGVLKSLSIAIVSLVTQIPGLIVAALGTITDLFASLFKAVGLDSVAGFFEGIGDALRTACSWLKENLVDPVVNWVKSLFGIHSPSTVFAEIGTFLIDGLRNGIKNAWSKIGEFFTNALSSVSNVISSAWSGIKSSTSTTWSNIKSSLSSTWSGIKSSLSTTWTNMKNTASGIWSGMKTAASNAWNGMKSNAVSTWNNIKSSLSGTWNRIKSTASTVWSGIKSTIQNKGWAGVGSNICSGISNGISNGWKWLKNKVSDLATGLLDSAKKVLGIHSPSRVFRDEVGLNMGLGVGEGFADSQSYILKSVTGVADAIADEMNSGTYSIKEIVPAAEINGAITNFTDTIANSFSSMLDRLQAIAESVTFAVPVVTNGIIPYKAAAIAAYEGGGTDIGTTIEASNDELAGIVTQVVTNAAASIVSAIQTHSKTTVNIDKNSLSEAVIQEINRRTRMANRSPLIG